MGDLFHADVPRHRRIHPAQLAEAPTCNSFSVDLSMLLLICAIVTALFSAFAARFRRNGTDVSDLAIGTIVAALMTLLVIIVLVLSIGLNVFGILHLLYLQVVVAFPIAAAFLVFPHLLDREFRTPFLAYVVGIAAVALALTGYWATHVEPFNLKVDRQALGASGVDRPVIIGVIADLQAEHVSDYERSAVEKVLAAEPDIVFLPGDLYQLDEEDFSVRAPEFVGLLRQLTDAVDHVVIVEGDADDPEGVGSIADDAGALFLQDQIIDLDLGGQVITVVGVTVPVDDSSSEIDPLIAEQLSANYDSDDLVVLLTHRPDPVLSVEAGSPIDLTIAGHTHGGQVSIPGIGPLIPFTDVPRTVAAGGLHLLNGQPIYVSTGVGIERDQAPQVRFRVRPSVGVITIVPS